MAESQADKKRDDRLDKLEDRVKSLELWRSLTYGLATGLLIFIAAIKDKVLHIMGLK